MTHGVSEPDALASASATWAPLGSSPSAATTALAPRDATIASAAVATKRVGTPAFESARATTVCHLEAGPATTA